MKKLFTNIKDWWSAHGLTKRRLIQLYSALLFNCYLKGYITGNIFTGVTKYACTPGLNCYSCPGAVTSCPIGSLQSAFSASKKTAPYYMLGILMLYGILFGRWICGWLCPFGLLQDLLHKIKTPKIKKSGITKALSVLKYIIVVIFVFIIPLVAMTKDIPLPSFCKYICPAGTVGGAFGLLINPNNSGKFLGLGSLFTWKFLLSISIIVSCIFIYRTFCRFLCPLGAIYGLFNKFSIFGIKLEKNKCINCGKCITTCKMDIHHVGDMECIHCGECISVCPTKAISYKGSKIILPDSEIESAKTEEEKNNIEEKRTKRVKIIRIVTSIVLIVALCFSLIYCNFIFDDDITPEITEEGGDYTVGNKIGNKCPSYDLELVDGSGTVNVRDFEGKVVIINFWGTWCSGCVKELPHFNQVADEYSDDVVVIAIHTVQDKNTAQEYIDTYYPESKMIFAFDEKLSAGKDMYYVYLGGQGSYPRTLVLDKNGLITFSTETTLTHEELVDAVENAKK